MSNGTGAQQPAALTGATTMRRLLAATPLLGWIRLTQLMIAVRRALS